MGRYFKEFYRFLKHIVENASLLKILIINDFKKDYLGSYLGLLWGFILPLSFILVIWFVFEVGFRTAPVSGDVPFFLWLMSGMIPWFYFANALSSITMAVVSNSFLVKKVAFRVSILPLVPMGSALILHLGLVFILMIIFFLYGFKPSIYWLQLPYYTFILSLFLLGIGWLISSLRVFILDVGNAIAVLIQFGFWFTPIFWSISLVPEKYLFYIKLNPMFYIIQGYRDTFINHVWFWEHPVHTLYFLAITLFFFVFGALVFKRLRPHFGDVI
ncbi:MAG: teichoic acid ABC transporter permease [Sulfurovum sp.]|nr:MAG: teichoic acid ABC transporter permease [Sulfurovum sp.]